jgi:hypothetical protein
MQGGGTGEGFVCNNAAMTTVSWDDKKYSLYTNSLKKKLGKNQLFGNFFFFFFRRYNFIL